MTEAEGWKGALTGGVQGCTLFFLAFSPILPDLRAASLSYLWCSMTHGGMGCLGVLRLTFI